MQKEHSEVVVAGHTCLDFIPTFAGREEGVEALFVPGQLLEVGPAVTATGGAVPNAGLALHRLGIRTRLMGKVGDDLVGRAILDTLRQHEPTLADGMIVSAGEHSSYTVVINPPGVDRIFFHYPGPNDTFGADDVVYEQLDGACLFHFGYPPLMRRMYIDEGRELAALLGRVKERGVTTSLDMSKPDPESEAGRAAWPALLERALPQVDVFLPSFDEIMFMLDRERFERMQEHHGPADVVPGADGSLLGEVSDRLLQLGAAIVVLKLGEQGAYLRTTNDPNRLADIGPCCPQAVEQWLDRELLAPCFQVDVSGTTGAGDCTVAGFLAGVVKGLSPVGAMTAAVAVGACGVEGVDAVSGVPSWSTVQERIGAGWDRLAVDLSLPDWHWGDEQSLWHGPDDRL
ncbi:MAG: 2-dehydro-3-deoxygluconokinase [Anaerolineales bacterium]|nr:2-dehydro-3-deoxygluconokinase [Anaerolineales bacterium]